MGYESKNKNLFYDEEIGFWFIDFLKYKKEDTFDINNIKHIFETLRYVMPKPIQISSTMGYNKKLEPEQEKRITFLENQIRAKTLLAIKAVIPNFEKYEKFYLFNSKDSFKKYLMEQKIISKDLFKLEDKDYETYDELYQFVVNNIATEIINNGDLFWNVKENVVRNQSDLFCLRELWKIHKDNYRDISSYDDKYDYEYDVLNDFRNKMIDDIVTKLALVTPNDNVTNFLKEVKEKNKNVPKV